MVVVLLVVVVQGLQVQRSLPYGAAENVHSGFHCANQREQPKQNISRPTTIDRKANLESLFLSFTAEHGLPLSLLPELVKLAQETSRDLPAINTLKMGRTCGSYKLTDGLHSAIHDTGKACARSKEIQIFNKS